MMTGEMEIFERLTDLKEANQSLAGSKRAIYFLQARPLLRPVFCRINMLNVGLLSTSGTRILKPRILQFDKKAWFFETFITFF